MVSDEVELAARTVFAFFVVIAMVVMLCAIFIGGEQLKGICEITRENIGSERKCYNIFDGNANRILSEPDVIITHTALPGESEEDKEKRVNRERLDYVVDFSTKSAVIGIGIVGFLFLIGFVLKFY
jgi:hypothetical protein